MVSQLSAVSEEVHGFSRAYPLSDQCLPHPALDVVWVQGLAVLECLMSKLRTVQLKRFRASYNGIYAQHSRLTVHVIDLHVVKFQVENSKVAPGCGILQ